MHEGGKLNNLSGCPRLGANQGLRLRITVWNGFRASGIEVRMRALVFNPGSNSLKFEVVEVGDRQGTASEAKKLVSASFDDIGKGAKLSVFDGRKQVRQEDCDVADMPAAAEAALEWLGEAERRGWDDRTAGFC